MYSCVVSRSSPGSGKIYRIDDQKMFFQKLLEFWMKIKIPIVDLKQMHIRDLKAKKVTAKGNVTFYIINTTN